jgi:alpha-D-ribose 1-methylphosphonate 5-triphosphate diphosphatase
MLSSVVFKNAQMVLHNEVLQGSLSIERGLISDINEGDTALAAAVDLQGDYLLPGFVEIHTDNFERHLIPRPAVHWAELPALLAHDAEIAASGITTVLDAMGVGDVELDSLRGGDMGRVIAVIDDCTERDILRADHHLHVRCELPAPNTIDLFKPFHEHPRLSLISVMDHTPGQRQWEDLEHARVYYTGKKGWSQDKFERQVAHAQTLQTKYSVPHRAYFVDYCRTHGIALASHDDTTTAQVQQACDEGALISEFPTTLDAAREAHSRGLRTVMGGPNVVRGGSHSGNVAAAELARHGLLDILSSDYVPGSLLTAVLRLVDDELLSLPHAVATVTRNPAQATGLNDRGELTAGLRADLIQVRMVEMPNGKHHGVVRGVWRLGKRVL